MRQAYRSLRVNVDEKTVEKSSKPRETVRTRSWMQQMFRWQKRNSFLNICEQLLPPNLQICRFSFITPHMFRSSPDSKKPTCLSWTITIVMLDSVGGICSHHSRTLFNKLMTKIRACLDKTWKSKFVTKHRLIFSECVKKKWDFFTDSCELSLVWLQQIGVEVSEWHNCARKVSQ